MLEQVVRGAFLASCVTALTTVLSLPVLRGRYETNFGGHWQFLTVLGLTSTTLSIGGRFVQRALGIHRGSTVDALHQLFIASSSVQALISVWYWTCYFLAPQLMYPPGVDRIPLSLDLGLHAVPFVAIWTELLFFTREHVYRRSHVHSLLLFAVFYTGWIHLCNYLNGYWMYPFLGMLTLPRRLVLISAIAAGTVGAYFGGLALHKAVQGRRVQQIQQKRRKLVR